MEGHRLATSDTGDTNAKRVNVKEVRIHVSEYENVYGNCQNYSRLPLQPLPLRPPFFIDLSIASDGPPPQRHSHGGEQNMVQARAALPPTSTRTLDPNDPDFRRARSSKCKLAATSAETCMARGRYSARIEAVS
jgi:hypothetical protein